MADECHGALDLSTESLDFTHGFSWTLHTVLTIRGESYRLLEQKKASLRLKAAVATDKAVAAPSSNKEQNLL